MATKIHPTADIDPSAELGEDVEVGPGACIEAHAVIGDRCSLGRNSIIGPYTRMGSDNQIGPMAYVGGPPQDVKFAPDTVSRVELGAHNIVREFATINRATTPGGVTRLGDRNFLFVSAHIGHDSTVGSNNVFANGCAMAGHVTVGDRAFFSAHSMVHQFCWVGDLVMTQGLGAYSMHMPPYCVGTAVNVAVGLNTVGLRRAEYIDKADMEQIRQAYTITYRKGLPLPKALAEMDTHTEWAPAADKFRRFVRQVLEAQGRYKRGLVPARAHKRSAR